MTKILTGLVRAYCDQAGCGPWVWRTGRCSRCGRPYSPAHQRATRALGAQRRAKGLRPPYVGVGVGLALEGAYGAARAASGPVLRWLACAQGAQRHGGQA